MERGVRKNRFSKPEDDVEESGILTPLYEEGEKGGNPESPAPEELTAKETVPRDPMGYLTHLSGDSPKHPRR